MKYGAVFALTLLLTIPAREEELPGGVIDAFISVIHDQVAISGVVRIVLQQALHQTAIIAIR